MAYFTSRSQVWLNSRLKQRTTPKFRILWTVHLKDNHFFWIIRHDHDLSLAIMSWGGGGSLAMTFVFPGLFPPIGLRRAKNGTGFCTNPLNWRAVDVPRGKIIWQAFTNFNVGRYYLTGKQ